MRALAGGDPGTHSGRWIWAVSGVVTAAAVAIPGLALLARVGVPTPSMASPQSSTSRAVTVSQHVTSITVDGDGTPVIIRAGHVSHVLVTEVIDWGGPGSGPADRTPPPVSETVSGGHLTLAAAQCDPAASSAPSGDAVPADGVSESGTSNIAASPRSANPAVAASGCGISFNITTPPGVTATVLSRGGVISVDGIAGADLNSSGGLISVDDVTGTLTANTGGGPLIAEGLSARSAAIATGGGPAALGYSAAPDTVTIRTGGGQAQLGVPGGPYALTADSGGGPETIEISTSSTARRSITVSTDGGPLSITSHAGGLLKGFPPLPSISISVPRLSANLGFLHVQQVIGVSTQRR